MNAVVVTLLTTAALCAAAGQLLFKVGADGRQNLTEFINPHIMGGAVLYFVGTAIWIYVLSSENLVNVYAFTALTFVAVYVGGVFGLGEVLSGRSILGIVLILTGLYFIVAPSAPST